MRLTINAELFKDEYGYYVLVRNVKHRPIFNPGLKYCLTCRKCSLRVSINGFESCESMCLRMCFELGLRENKINDNTYFIKQKD